MSTYFEEFIAHDGSRQPLALYKRDVMDDVNVDRIYTLDGTWLPTGELAAWSLGGSDSDNEQVDENGADSFIDRVKSSYLE